MDIARVINLVLVALQVRGLMLSGVSERRWMLFAFYTQLSNLLAGAASLLLVVLGRAVGLSQRRQAMAACESLAREYDAKVSEQLDELERQYRAHEIGYETYVRRRMEIVTGQAEL